MSTIFLRGHDPVEVKDLISFDMGFGKLGALLGNIVDRLNELENNKDGSNDNTAGGAPSSSSAADENNAASHKDADHSGDVEDRLRRLENAVAELKQDQQQQQQQQHNSPSATGDKSSFDARSPLGDNASALDNIQQQLNDLHDAVDGARQQASSAKKAAEDADRKADNVGDRLRSHIRFAHAPGDETSNNTAEGDQSANNNNTNNDNETTTGADASNNSRPGTQGSACPSELADEQNRQQRELDRLQKQLRDQHDELEAMAGQIRSLQRQALGTPSTSSSRAGGSGVDLRQPFSDLSKRVAELEEKQETLERLVGPKAYSSHKARGEDGAADEDLAGELGAIRGHLTTHDVAIEDLQKQMAATLGALSSGGAGGDGDGAPKEVLAAAITSLQNRIKPLEDQQREASHSLRQLDQLRRNAATKDDLSELRKDHDYLARSTHNQLEKLEAKVAELDKTVKEHIKNAGLHGVSADDFERLQHELRRLESDLQTLANNGGGAGGDSDKNKDGVSDVAAGMLSSRLDSLQQAVDDLAAKLGDTRRDVKDVDSRLGDANGLIKANTGRIQGLEAMVRRAADEAAHAGHDARTAGDAIEGILKRLSQLANANDHLTDRLNHVDNAVTTMAASSARGGGGAAGSNGTSGVSPEFEKMVRAELEKLRKFKEARESQPDPSMLGKDLEGQKDWSKGQFVDIRAILDHMRHTKADSSQVAGKADRDYVENALEKLMREVEGVINSTNAGLIDTLDKSLGLLRDMIDGKATKSDVAKVRNLIGASEVAAGSNAGGGGGGNAAGSQSGNSAGVAADGLLGVQSYRCLGCNRTVEHMRPRPMGAQFANFMSRVPPGGGGAAQGSASLNGTAAAGMAATNSASAPRTASSAQGGTRPLLIPAPPGGGGAQQTASTPQ